MSETENNILTFPNNNDAVSYSCSRILRSALYYKRDMDKFGKIRDVYPNIEQICLKLAENILSIPSARRRGTLIFDCIRAAVRNTFEMCSNTNGRILCSERDVLVAFLKGLLEPLESLMGWDVMIEKKSEIHYWDPVTASLLEFQKGYGAEVKYKALKAPRDDLNISAIQRVILNRILSRSDLITLDSNTTSII